MSLPDLPSLLGEVHQLTRRYQSGRPDAFDAFRELVSLLLHHTVADPTSGVRLTYGPQHRDAQEPVLGGWRGPDDSVVLRNGHYLRLSVILYFEETPHGRRAKVRASSYQYQLDREGEQWVFRYDYLRIPPHPYPAAHLQLRGTLANPCLPGDLPLERIHFPTGRVSLEAVIRLLADQFGIPCSSPPELWRPLLAESERAFLEIAHRPLSGPEQ